MIFPGFKTVPALPLAVPYHSKKEGRRARVVLQSHSTCARQGEEQVSWVKSSLQAELSVSLA